MTAQTATQADYLTSRQVASLLQVSVRTLEDWRYHGDYGPPAVRFGSAVRYSRRALDQWLRRQETAATKTPA